MAKTQTRTYEEIITLQDKAIEALTQANHALLLALETLKTARAEHGFKLQLPGLSLGGNLNPTYAPTYVPTYVPSTTNGIQWNNGQSTGVMTVTKAAHEMAAVNSVIQQANSQKQLAQTYTAAYQAWQKEQDALPKVGGCVSIS